MQITKHARQRYVERIKGITNTVERNAYITNNMERIDEHIETMFGYAQFVYRGRIGGDMSMKSFFIHQDIAFVVSENETIVTIFKINFEFPIDAKNYVINSLVRSIKELDEQIASEKEMVAIEVNKIDAEREANNLEIGVLEEKMRLLKSKNKLLEEEKTLLIQEVGTTAKEQERFAYQLFANTDYKQDIKDKDWK